MPVTHRLPQPAPSTPSTPPSTGLTPERTLGICVSVLFFVVCMFSMNVPAMWIGAIQLPITIWAPPIVGRLFWGALALYLGYHAIAFGSLPMIIVAAIIGVPALAPSSGFGQSQWQRRADRLRAEAGTDAEPDQRS